jgi:hypothetical protein
MKETYKFEILKLMLKSVLYTELLQINYILKTCFEQSNRITKFILVSVGAVTQQICLSS